MASGPEILDPTTPQQTTESIEQRLVRKVEGFKKRVSDLEGRTAPAGLGTGVPSSVGSMLGTQWMDQPNRSLYVLSDLGWINATVARSELYTTSTFTSTVSNSWELMDTLSVYVPNSGWIAFQVDVEMFPTQNASGIADAYVGLEAVTAGLGIQQMLGWQASTSGAANAWHRALSLPGNNFGNPFPDGRLQVMQVPPGDNVFKLYGQSSPTNTGVPFAQFRNRRLWVVMF